jgi:hypothetical protein
MSLSSLRVSLVHIIILKNTEIEKKRMNPTEIENKGKLALWLLDATQEKYKKFQKIDTNES